MACAEKDILQMVVLLEKDTHQRAFLKFVEYTELYSGTWPLFIAQHTLMHFIIDSQETVTNRCQSKA